MQETRTNDIHCLNLESWTWSEMYVAMCHCFTVLYLVTWCMQNLSSQWVFKLTVCIMPNRFSRIPLSPTPVGRSWHTLTAVSDNTLFLFGGLSVDCKPMSKKMYSLVQVYFLCCFGPFMSSSCFLLSKTNLVRLGDGWLLDVETKKWKELEHPFKNKPR